ncbi:condensation domain-containing protein [Streptomyces sp. M19]
MRTPRAAAPRRLRRPAPGAAPAPRNCAAPSRGPSPTTCRPPRSCCCPNFLTPDGRLDARALPTPPDDAPAAYTAPATETEKRVAAVWTEVLDVDRVGRDDDFFALGGHSLRATRAVSRLGGRLGAEIPLRTLFQHPSCARSPPPSTPSPSPPSPPPRTPSGAARGHRRAPVVRPAAAVVPRPTPARTPRLQHPRRTPPRRPTGHTGPHRRPRPDRPPPRGAAFPDHRRGRTPRPDRRARRRLRHPAHRPHRPAPDRAEAAALDLARDDAGTPFALGAAPLLRTRIIRVAEEAHLLVMVLHHTVGDGWSLPVLWRELSAAYAAQLRAPPRTMPNSPSSTPTSPTGSSGAWTPTASPRNWTTGGRNSPVRPRWNCRPTGRAPACAPATATPSRSSCPPTCATA